MARKERRLISVAGIVGWLACISTIAHAGPEDFHPGPVIEQYGLIADVEVTAPIPEGAELKVAFDLARGAEAGQVNRSLDTAARFINMHAANGVPRENIRPALVIHGGAVFDVTRDEKYSSAYGEPNGNAALVAALIEAGAEIYVCGQSAAARDVETGDLLPGVNMALSAMTAHALLQRSGFTLNPF